MSDLKVEGKVADFCPKCKNCKSTTRECDGEKDWLTEVECEDPYDGMIKTLTADSDICCSMFAPKPDHGRYSWGKDKNENDSMCSELIKASKRKDELIQNYREKLKKETEAGSKIVEENVKLENEMQRLKEANENLLEKCKVYIDEKADLKLKVGNLQSNINFQKYLKDEAYKREDELKKELKKVKSHDEAITKHFQNDEKLIDNIQKVIFPQEEGSDYTYSYDEILNKVKELKVQPDENGTMYEDLKYWKKRCHNAESDVTTLNSKVEVLKNKIVSHQSTRYKQYLRILELEDEIKELRAKNQEYFNEISDRLAKHSDQCDEITKLKNENISLNTINKELAEDLRSAKDKLNYLYFKAKEFTNMED